MRFLRILPVLTLFFILPCALAESDLSGTYSGEHAVNKDTLLCEVTITAEGKGYAISGSYALESGRGATPSFDGSGKVNEQGTLVATFTDSFENTGTAMITPTDEGVTISIRVTDVKDPRCIPLYKECTLKKQ
ncbi:hypothetical protein TSACC_23218 [Terrimicrobium sacchariphilum]|jgi:hypothetical protein|uniref:Uncharacterized protein n=1 Tax=Terrimicrobium sacchariphilum TaxID=690879 RepID=A0A146GDH7_TERSA|nr:hypothetical protein [Terrimicrobium sacchariphilum]GAT34784.1 hypothetical protein TSACC_23218 [Terrimicrobium sacchariphilum]